MKTSNLRKLIAVFLLLLFTQAASAQIYVKIRPPRPAVVITPPPMPAPGYIWVEDDWVPQGRTYVYKGGYWVAPPRPHAVWVPGHWTKHRKGHKWVKGHWRR